MALTRNFADTSFGGLSFTGISVSEVDVGTVTSFVNSPSVTMSAGNQPSPRNAAFQGLDWSSFSSGALAPGSSTTLTFSYDVTETTSGMGINGLHQAFTVDTLTGSGLSLTAVEYVYDANNNLVGQSTINLTTSSANGPVAPGDFAPAAAFQMLHVQVVVTAAVAPTSVAPAAVNFSIIDQGFHQTSLANQASLGDTVWEDANNNGVQDAGESGISGVTVNLLDSTGHATGLTTVTDVNGHYAFTALNVGAYEVQFVKPSGYSFSPTGQGNAATDSNPDTSTGITAPVTLVAGQNDITIDAGLYRPASLGDYVFFDANNNGIQDSGDTAVSGVTVNLLDATGATVLGTTTTDSSGLYHFTNLAPGTYEVQFVKPVGYNFTQTGQGTAATDSNADTVTGYTAPITLVSGENNTTIDAGLVAQGGSNNQATAALGDTVFYDVNANGIQDSGETGISGVTVNLLDATGTTILGTTTTDSTGYYDFTSLAAGTYEVAFIKPTGYAAFSPTGQGTPATDSNPDITTGVTAPVTLIDGQFDRTIDAGLYRLASLGDYVFDDVNGNGIQDSGDTGISGVTVNLLDATGASVLGTTTTDGTGYYHFVDLTPGTYEVQFIKPATGTFSPTGQGTSATDSNPNQSTGITGPVTLLSGQVDNTIDAGILMPHSTPPGTGSIGDYVWNDCNWNGIQDGCEEGVSGVTVNLLDSSGTSILATTTTDGTGHYLFNQLSVGTYEVQFIAPSGTTFTSPLQGTDLALDSNVITVVGNTGTTSGISLAADQAITSIDAGLHTDVSLHEASVFQSISGPMTAAQVYALNGCGASYGPPAPAHFTEPGPIVIDSGSATPLYTGPSAGNVDTLLFVLSATPTIDPSALITFSFGSSVVVFHAVDFSSSAADGFPNKISGIGNGAVNGIKFTNALHAAVEVTFNAPLNAFGGTDSTIGNVRVDSSIDLRVDIFGVRNGAIVSNAANSGAIGVTGDPTFGDCCTDGGGGQPKASLGDLVFEDCNGNGIQDAGESGVGSVTVQLLNAAGTSVLATTTTDSTGHYLFSNLDAGTYTVKFVAPSGTQFTTPFQGGDTAKDSNANASGRTDQITLAAGDNNLTIDAGIYKPASLGNLVFYDCNGNGVRDWNDSGVSGVTVNLLDGTGTTVLATTTTNWCGQYVFNNLAPGTYEVQFIAPDGKGFTAQDQGWSDSKDSDANTATGITAPITLTCGECNGTVDAGLITLPTTAKLGDLVFEDCNGNGIQDAGESGIGCVTVKLLNAAGTSVLKTTTTDSSGRYLFTNLAAGTYTVQFVAPNGMSFTKSLQGSDTAKDSDANASGRTAQITLAAGDNNTTIDAGLYKPASLGDIVFNDCNGNGVRDWNDTGVSGVTVKLLDGSGTTVLDTTTTNWCGQYSFTNLAPGTYQVQFVAPNGKSFTAQNRGSDDSKDSDANTTTGKTGVITLSCGECDSTVDAGLVNGPVKGAIGDLVFNDANHNGIQDTGESGISGVTVKLLSGNTVLSTTSTDSTGHYLFNNLNAGSYVVQFIASTGYTISPSLRGSDTAKDSDANTSTGKSATISLSAGQTNLTIDAGMYRTSSGGGGGCGGWTYYDDGGHGGGCAGGNSGGWGGSCWGGSNYDSWGSHGGGSSYGGYGCGSSYGGSSYGSYGGSYGGYGGYGGSSYGGYGGSSYGDCGSSYGGYGGSYGGYGGSSYGGNSGWDGGATYCGGSSSGGSSGGLNWGSSSGDSWCASDSHAGGAYSGGGNWGSCGWNGSSWTGGQSGSSSGPGEVHSICGNVKQVEFTYHHCDTVSSDTFSTGCGSSSGHNGNSLCFIQITDKSGDHAWGSKTFYEGTVRDGDKLQTDSSIDLTSCGGKLYAHVYASQADCNAGRGAIQEISLDCSGGRDLYLGSQIGSLSLTGYTGSHGSCFTNW